VRWIAVLVLLALLPLVLGEYYVNLGSQILIFGVFAASINLLLGYGGLLLERSFQTGAVAQESAPRAGFVVRMLIGHGDVEILPGSGHLMTEAADHLRDRLGTWIPDQLDAAI